MRRAAIPCEPECERQRIRPHALGPDRRREPLESFERGLWIAARDPQTPAYARLFGLLIAAYALSPIDLIPDFIPILGLVDDAVIVPLGVWLFIRMLPKGAFERHRAAAAEAATRPTSRAGIALVVAAWIVLALIGWSMLRWTYS